MDDEFFMRMAIKLAEASASLGEIPVGALVVRDGRVVGSGHNKRENAKNALLHAEICAIDEACKALGSWRLSGCSLYVTLEPCPMCAGAIINSRIERLVYGASDPKAGACGSVINLFACGFNHTPRITRGVLGDECSDLLSNFFRPLRSGGGDGQQQR